MLLNESIQIGEKFQGCLTRQDFILICNFSPGELVVYQSTNTEEYQYARVVKTQYQPGCEITECYLQLLVKPNSTYSIFASPLQVYKILDTSQTAILWSTSSLSGFSASLTLADIPHQLAPLKKWLKDVYTTSFLRHSISLCRLSQRLVAHMHYTFVTLKVCPELFREGAKEVLKLLEKESNTLSDDFDFNMCTRMVEDLVRQLTGGLPPTSSVTMSSLSPVIPDVSEVTHFSVLPGYQPPLATPATTPSPVMSTSHPPPPSQQTPPTGIGGSRLSQLVHNAQFTTSGSNFPPSTQYYPPHLLTPGSIALTLPCVRPPVTDSIKAKIWLQQAKADLLAAHYLYNGESHLPAGQSHEEEVDESSDDEECLNQPACQEQNTCRFPALICFLTHDVVEKCLKGVLYAKSGLQSSLVTSNVVVELMEKVEQSTDYSQRYKQVVKECTMLVCEHISKSRYPNHQVPPCAPAEVYTVPQATEALAAATRLMEETKCLPNVGELIGDLNKLTTTLSILETGEGEVSCMQYTVVP